MDKILMSGNEAIARGAWEAGAKIGVAYPGTPSTETLETFARMDDVYAEWNTNEKVAVEVGLGASAAGSRVLATMKMVGVNVAADLLYTAAYAGVNGGFVILAADDPGMYSSQNEQDSHWYAQGAHIPIVDPSDAQEALDFTKQAYEWSEQFDVPFFVRSTVRVSHTRTLVETGDRVSFEPKLYETDPAKWVMMPAYAKPRRKVQLDRIDKLSAWAEDCPINKEIIRSDEIGVICSGAVYQHVIEALPHASVFKLGLTWPLPANALGSFASKVKEVYVIEEASEYLTTQVRALGIKLSAPKNPLPRDGELTPGLIRQAFGISVSEHADAPADLPGRPPALCAGCPHRLVFKELSRIKAIVTGDIGCYTLGALPPLAAMDTCVDMGASVSMSHGFELALANSDHRPVVAVIGDSTFAHSGLSSLISTVYNKGCGTVCILDNRTTAMTGRQGNPFNGQTLQKRPSRELDLMGVLNAIGVDNALQVDPHDMKAVRDALAVATKDQADELTVIVFKAPCQLIDRIQKPVFHVADSCRGCKICTGLGCPAISFDKETNRAEIDAVQCCGCGQCSQYCPFGAIVQHPESEEA